jgi:serine phosphatase RsbU (regulator of sigma subunit)
MVGVCALVFDHPHAFSAHEQVLATGLAGHLAQALARARLYDDRRTHLTELQDLMLPHRLPPVPGLDLLVLYRPSSAGLEVGGDWYDLIPMPDGRVCAVIGDVQGHSARAAGVMGQLRVAMRTHARDGHELAGLMRCANESLCAMDTDLFATCCLVDITPRDGTLRVVRAGHSHPMVLMPDGQVVHLTGPGGLPLGMFETEEEYPVHSATLPENGTLLMYTDGLVERPGRDYDDGVAELSERLAYWSVAPESADGLRDLDDLAERVITPAVTDEAHADDIAVLLVRRLPGAGAASAGVPAPGDGTGPGGRPDSG